jgi:hypothetical protein
VSAPPLFIKEAPFAKRIPELQHRFTIFGEKAPNRVKTFKSVRIALAPIFSIQTLACTFGIHNSPSEGQAAVFFEINVFVSDLTKLDQKSGSTYKRNFGV